MSGITWKHGVRGLVGLATQIEEHKQEMIAVGETDVPMNMVKMGGGSDTYQVGISVVNLYEGQVNPYRAADGAGHGPVRRARALVL